MLESNDLYNLEMSKKESGYALISYKNVFRPQRVRTIL